MTEKKNEVDEQRKKQMQEFKQNKVKEQEIFLPVNLSGPTNQRQATDKAYAQILVFIIIGFIAIGGYAYYKSNIQTIIPLLDYQDNTCGQNKKELFPELYFQKLEKGWKPICVNQCPDQEMKEWDSYYEQYDNIKISKSYKTTKLLHLCIPDSQAYQEQLGLKQII